MSDNGSEERNVMLYMLAGIGLGALIGAAAGLLFAPKPGSEIREDLGKQLSDLKKKAGDWYTERKHKTAAEIRDMAEEAAAG